MDERNYSAKEQREGLRVGGWYNNIEELERDYHNTITELKHLTPNYIQRCRPRGSAFRM